MEKEIIYRKTDAKHNAKRTRNFCVFLAFLFCVSLAMPAAAEAANLYFSPVSGNYAQGENFTVSILVNAEKPVNAVSGTISFNTKYLEVLSLSYASSIINLWVVNPTFSNKGSTGNVNFEGVIFNPGYTGFQGRVIDVVFRAKSIGSTNLVYSNSAILANDGEGTNVASSSGSATFNIIKSQAPPQEVLEKIKKIEEDIKTITEKPAPKPVVIVQTSEAPPILKFWNSLPAWLRGSVIAAVSILTLIFLFIIGSLLLIVMVWLWGHVWRRRQIWAYNVKRFFLTLLLLLGLARRELKGDILYGVHEFKEEFSHAGDIPSFRMVLINYCLLIGRVTKRFFTKNEG
ncbi:MAG: hypothetical protein A3A98_00935 [Candidatus Staskawiczbacteria bacterium RIFCSPLOWO2_01_FULL_40_39]|uniref:Cohesin domain-containing protein n=1 Tax=Candidatus Staskawiczbacteria bacterium RIFCSPHIGHO2_01_FULL_39_25 TaxID=1802202 RepID=A0A1G2HMV5_9BACT|nr:MAG: hypothetical protein A2730_00935 [Candidatus Staskawiczbacteria bacterium RIFCSPHIGHO2_01_FULL_39_25]OGZ73295.1 MAG: hypothetical protein A3A98_00935 [Candidatus Staskawiczbacteria bacterium RIFCSPLOWO2_01_FULL_40_39]